MPENQEVLRAAVAILGYWRDHPNAKDNAKGIAQYWVGEPEEIALSALNVLMAEGVIIKRRNLYRLTAAPLKQKKAQADYWNTVMQRLHRKFRRQQ